MDAISRYYARNGYLGLLFSKVITTLIMKSGFLFGNNTLLSICWAVLCMDREQAISELLCSSLSEQVFVQSLSYQNEFDFHENESVEHISI